jgi:hypothetical protein
MLQPSSATTVNGVIGLSHGSKPAIKSSFFFIFKTQELHCNHMLPKPALEEREILKGNIKKHNDLHELVLVLLLPSCTVYILENL